MGTDSQGNRNRVRWPAVCLARGDGEQKAGFRRDSLWGGDTQSAEAGYLIKYLLLCRKCAKKAPFLLGEARLIGQDTLKKKKQVEWLVSVQENHPHTGECCLWTHVSWLVQGHCLHTPAGCPLHHCPESQAVIQGGGLSGSVRVDAGAGCVYSGCQGWVEMQARAKAGNVAGTQLGWGAWGVTQESSGGGPGWG